MSTVVGALFGNSTVDGSSTSENVSGPEENDSSICCPLMFPEKWTVYLPTVVGKKNASYSPRVPSPVSASNEGSSASAFFRSPTSTSTFRLGPRSVTAFPLLVARKNCTKFSWSRYAGSLPNPTVKRYAPTLRISCADAGAALSSGSANAAPSTAATERAFVRRIDDLLVL